MYGQNPMLTSESWGDFVKMQGPAIQGLMGSYLEQSANAFLEMQQQLHKQTRNLFGTFPFSGFPGTPQNNPDTPPKRPDSGGEGKN
jgi:polyhydroxyalkanoate synthesis regulator protein